MKIIPERLNAIMKERHVKRGELAEVMHVSENIVSRWRAGDRGISKRHLLELCELFAVDMDFFTAPKKKLETGADLMYNYIQNNPRIFTREQKKELIKTMIESLWED